MLKLQEIINTMRKMCLYNYTNEITEANDNKATIQELVTLIEDDREWTFDVQIHEGIIGFHNHVDCINIYGGRQIGNKIVQEGKATAKLNSFLSGNNRSTQHSVYAYERVRIELPINQRNVKVNYLKRITEAWLRNYFPYCTIRYGE